MATTYVDPTAGFATHALQARTDDTGAAVDDVEGVDMRLVGSLFVPGVAHPDDAFQVRQRGAGANMSVDVGSGDAFTDLAIVAGDNAGQGAYIVRLGDAVTNVAVAAADLSQPRIDEVYLVVEDDAYDSSSRVLARLAYRDGTPSGSPTPPGPDGDWSAYLLLASILVTPSATSIVNADITDQRPQARLRTPSAVAASIPSGSRVLFDQDTAPIGWTRDTSGVLNDRMIRLVTGARVHGGTWTQPTHVHTTPQHNHPMPHTHNLPHNHAIGSLVVNRTTAIGQEGTGPTFLYTTGNPITLSGQTAQGSPQATSQPSNSNTGQGGGGNTGAAATPNTWRPLHRDMIVAVKD